MVRTHQRRSPGDCLRAAGNVWRLVVHRFREVDVLVSFDSLPRQLHEGADHTDVLALLQADDVFVHRWGHAVEAVACDAIVVAEFGF